MNQRLNDYVQTVVMAGLVHRPTKLSNLKSGRNLVTSDLLLYQIHPGRIRKSILQNFHLTLYFYDREFEFWKKQMERCGCTLPTHGHIAAKAKKLEGARKHVITDTEIEKMVREKEKYRSAPVNFATKKTTLIKLRDAAETEGNIDQVSILYPNRRQTF